MDNDSRPGATTMTEVPTSTAPERPTPSLPAQPEPASLSPPPVSGYWDRYEVLDLLGKGGMGAVYKARDRKLDRFVALKFLRGDHPGLTRRFMQEARSQARIEHGHVCKVHDVGEHQGHAFIAMQFIDGLPLSALHSQMPFTDKVVLLATIADAIHAAHRQGIIHRDIKPSNIMVERREDGTYWPVVMDFGLAHDPDASQALTQSGALLGTPQYMPPEQARGETRSVDRRSDVYSLGAVLYELLTAQPPFVADSVTAILLQVLDQDPIPPRRREKGIPEALEIIALKCLQKDPAQRYESARALAEDLRRYLDGEPIVGQRTSVAYRFARWARKRWAVVGLGGALLLSILLAIGYGVRIRVQARRQQQVAQRLGQEIKDMEWLLRTARGMPLHNLEREKNIVRERMATLQAELTSLGEIGRPLVHYALGRGHMALHEYPQALEQLQQAIAQGYEQSEAYHSLGLVLGKHFEQAMYEARMSGGGDWAQKELRLIEPKYLTPAIAALSRSRNLKLDRPEYLEALISYYKRDYETALIHAAKVLNQAPWMYEASKLAGDIHHERALQARDRGKYPDAESEFAAAVRSYDEAAAIGQSDAEVYEALAETWVRRVEMDVHSGQYKESSYEAALTAADKVIQIEPRNPAGPLKKSFAVMFKMEGLVRRDARRIEELVAQAIEWSMQALTLDPNNPYASELYAVSQLVVSDQILLQGGNAESVLQTAEARMESVVKRHPRFLWGLNDLGQLYGTRAVHLYYRGDGAARSVEEKSIAHLLAALNLDPEFLNGYMNIIAHYSFIHVLLARSKKDLDDISKSVESFSERCKKINAKFAECYNNKALFYESAAERLFLAGGDPKPYLLRAVAEFAELKRLGGSFRDAEQGMTRASWVEASDRVLRGLDPAPALDTLRVSLARCLALSADDPVCRDMAIRADWVAADWAARTNHPPLPLLQSALAKAVAATQLPTTLLSHDLWQTLAETHLRIARADQDQPPARERHITDGLAALQHIFAINPHHARAHATAGALYLLSAQTASDPAARSKAAVAAVAALDHAVQSDPFLTAASMPVRTQAQALAPRPQ